MIAKGGEGVKEGKGVRVEGVGASRLSHRVARGKVCTGAGALSVRVKASDDSLGLGTALC